MLTENMISFYFIPSCNWIDAKLNGGYEFNIPAVYFIVYSIVYRYNMLLYLLIYFKIKFKSNYKSLKKYN